MRCSIASLCSVILFPFILLKCAYAIDIGTPVQNWSSLDANVNGLVSSYNSNTNIVIDSQERIFVATGGGATPQQGRVYKFEGGAWTLVANNLFGDYRLPDMAIGNDQLYIVRQAGLSTNSSIVVYRSIDAGASWNSLGSVGTRHQFNNNTIAVDSLGTPYVAYPDATNNEFLTVKKYNGSTWVTVGSALNTTNSRSQYIDIQVDNNNRPFLLFSDPDNSDLASVVYFDGSNWLDVGLRGFSGSVLDYGSLAFNANNQPVIAYSTGTKGGVYQFDGSAWQALGDDSFDDANGDVNLGLDAGDDLSDSASSRINSPSIQVNDLGKPTVAYSGGNTKGYVKQWDGSAWQLLGSGEFNGNASRLSFASSNLSNVVSFVDGNSSAKYISSGLSYSVVENNTTIATLPVSNAVASVTWSIAGGADSAKFSIDGSTGALSFVVAPSYAAPTDSNLDNVYVVSVTADDGTDNDTVVVEVAITEDTAPVILYGSKDGVLSLDGTTTKVDVSESTDLSFSNGNQVSIAAWSNVTDTSNSTILVKTDGLNATDISYNLRVFLGQYQMVVSDGSNYAVCYAPLIINTWQHVVGTYDGTGTPKLYIDGVLQTCANPRSATISNLRLTTADVAIGYYPGSAGQEYNGKLDEVALWNTTLTAAEISSIYNTGNYVSTLASSSNSYGSAGNLQGYWRFNEGSGASVADSSQNASTGAISGAATWDVQDLFGIDVIELTSVVDTLNVFDSEGDTITWSISGGVDQALFNINSVSGELTFVVPPDYSVPSDSDANNVYTLQLTATANGKTASVWVDISVMDNVLPVATGDSASVIRGSSIVIDVRANDSDSETNTSALTVTNISAAAHGVVVNNNDGTVTYTHNGSATLSDSFTYSINDGSEDSIAATVNISVTDAVFQCDGTVYHSRGKSLFSVDTSTLPFTYNQIGTTPTGISSNALGFNYADGYLYAMGSTNATRGHLIKVDVLGNFTDLGLVTGLPKKNYAHGAFDINGDYYVTENHKVHVIDVNTVSRKETIKVHANHGIDIAFNPRDKKLYSANRKSVRVTDLVAKTTKLIKMTGMPENAGTFGSHWFDSQGNLYVSANKSEDVYRIANPGTTPIATYIGRGEYNGQPYDAASCVGAPSLTHTISPTSLGAAGSVTHTYVIDNGLESGDATGDPLITGLQDTLDNGRTFVGGSLVVNGATVAPAENSYANTDTLTLSNLQVPAASKVSISIDVNIPTLSSGIYYNQAQMTNIPIGLGGDNSNLVPSDYPFGFKNPDPTPFEFTGSNNQISGTVFDDYDGDGVQDSNEPGLRGVLVTIDGNNSVLSDVNGNYRFDYLNDGTHTVVSSRLNAAWVDITPETVVSNNLSGGSSQQIDFAYSQGDGVVRGTIFYDLNADGQQQENELIIEGVNLSLKDKDGNVVGGTVTSDEAGQYRFKDLIPGLYWVEVTPPNNHASVSAPLISANVVSYKDVVVDFTFLSKNTISGTVFNDVDGDLNFDINELGLSGVVIELLDSNLNVYANTTTNSLGQYEFTALPAGSYTLVQTDLAGYISIGSNSINTSIPNSGAAVVNFADQETATISGIVFEDTNGNGVQDITEQGIGGVSVNLSGIGNATTDNAGLYIFSGIPNNNYTLSVGTVPNYLASPDQNVSVAAGASANANFALVLPGVIYGRLYIDSNQDLSSQESELAVANTQVLITGTGVDRYTFTDSDGYYQFESLSAQAYTVSFTTPSGYIATITTANINLAVGASLKQSFALNYIGVVSGRVYHDVDEDQVIDADEMGLANVSITLSGQGGAVSDMQGNYLFPFISNNSYSVTEIDPSGFESVSTNVVNVTVAGDTAYANFADKFANILPIANTQNLVTNEGVAINISLTGTDNDGTIVSYQLISTPSNGTLSGSVPNVIYTPAAGFDGTDSFTFTVTDDDSGISAVATISITVNNVNILPQATPQSLVTNEGEALNIVLSGSDSDGSIASYQVVSAPNNGVLSGAAPNLIYTPTIGFDGVDSFTFTVTDNDNGISAVATVMITVNNINLLPQADPQNLVTGVGDALNIKLSAADSDGSIVSYQVVNMPNHGKLLGTAPNLIYEPAVNFSGADSFTFVVTDNDNGTSALATVSILIVDSNQPPIANNDLISIGKNSINNLIEVLLNDSDPDNDTLSIVSVSALNGVVTIGPDGKIIYSPLANSIAQDVIEYTINDGNGHQANAVVIVTIEDNNLPPIALNDQYSLESSKSIVLDVLGNDSDPEGESLTLVSVNSRMGVVEIVDNKVIFTPDASTSGEYKFSYVIKDPVGNSAIGEVVVIIASDTGPTITLPEDLCGDLVVNANALYTRVNLGEASAIDRFGNPVPVSLLDGTQLYPPGINEAYWKATDFEGNTTVAKQLVCVIPLISIEKNQTVLEGESTNIGVFLNGESPTYPVIVPFDVEGHGEDHNLTSGQLIIEAGTSGYISVDTVVDSENERDEVVSVTLDSELNLGSKSEHLLTITEQNIAPVISLEVVQNGTKRLIVSKNDGDVQINATVYDANINDSQELMWQSITTNVVNTSLISTSYIFNPQLLDPGLYQFSLTAIDNGIPALSDLQHVYIEVVDSLEQLTGIDSDGDRIPDNIEGYEDSDGDGIPDYLDRINECNVLQEEARIFDGYLIEGQSGVCLRRGNYSSVSTLGGAQLVSNDFSAIAPVPLREDSEAINVGGIFDFIAYGLPQKGGKLGIVLPQRKPIPLNAVYRKYNADDGWFTFVEDENNSLWSTAGEPGYCPPPNLEPEQSQWSPGLNEGHWCVQLVIFDGGENDDDGLTNGAIVDPGGVAVLVNGNAPPVAFDDYIEVETHSPLVIDVLTNDVDPDGDVLTITSAIANIGNVVIAEGELIYTGPQNYSGNIFINYGITDNNGGTDFAVVHIAVPINKPPIINDEMSSISQGSSITLNLLANDLDPEGEALNLIAVESDLVDFTSNGGATFTPDTSFFGEVTITYQVQDIAGNKMSGRWTITVTELIELQGTTKGGGSVCWLLLLFAAMMAVRKNQLNTTRP